MTTLDTIAINERVIVTGVSDADPGLRQKLAVLGVVEGAELEVLNESPFKDPISVRVLRSVLAMRRAEARAVLVSRTQN